MRRNYQWASTVTKLRTISSVLIKTTLLCIAIVLLAYGYNSAAQVANSSISGHVFDPAGRVIAGARVTANNKDRGAVRTTTTDPSGAYTLLGLPPAEYTISAGASGFSDAEYSGVTLEVDSAITQDFHLVVGGPNTRVEVNEPASYLQMQSGDVGHVIEREFIQTLPLNARNFLQLALLVPGTFPPVSGSQLSSNGSNAMEVNGGREEYNNFLLDGADNNDPYVSGYVAEPPVDSVQEFKMVTSSYSAEYGRSAAGQVNVVTRRGSNTFNADIYEYLRNKVLDSRNYFDTKEFVKPPYIRNQFGVAVGGPIRMDKTFFFANTDFFRQRQSLAQQALVPTEAQRSGDLSSLGTPVFNPFTGEPFEGGIIPDSMISPVAKEILKMYPQPNLSASLNNFLGQPRQPEDHTQITVRGDHSLSVRDELTLRYAMGIVNAQVPYQAESAGSVPGFGSFNNDRTHNALIREQHVFGPSTLNSVWVAFNRFSREFLPENYRTDVGKQWGVDWLDLPARDYGYPVINVSGFSSVGDDTGFPNLRHTNTYQVADDLTIVRGKHTLSLGGEFRNQQLNGHLDMLARGSLSFYGFITGSPLGDLLLGYPSFGLRSQVKNPIRLRTSSYNVYAQDDFKISQALVLNLGARYEFNSPAVDPTNGMSELNTVTGEIVQVGTNGMSRSGIHADYKNFAPRIGIAWRANDNLVVRGGYGVFFDSGMFIVGSAAYFNPPQFLLNVYFPSEAGLLTLDNPFPTASAYPPPASLSVLSPSLVTPYFQQWNVSTEESFGKRGALTLSYIGSSGSRLIRGRDLNQPVLSPTGSQDNLQSRRPYPDYGSIFYVESKGSSNFNAFETSYTGHPFSSLLLTASYTFSHSIDDASAFLGNAADPNFPQNSYNIAAERGASSFDMRHRFAAAYVLTLPRGNRWTRNTDFRGIAVAESGQPFTPTISFDNSNTGNTGQQSGADRPNQIASAHLAHPTASQWFNTAAFVIAPPNTFGSAGRNCLRGPGYASLDVSLARRFDWSERSALTIEAQAFNVFNHPNLSLPAAVADQPNFGSISSASSPRELQLAARFSF